jgi:hypothetical protein
MRVLLLQLDGKLPNIALMRLSAHHKALGNHVEFRRAFSQASVQVGLFDDFDLVYASLIFLRTRHIATALKAARPDAIIGGTGWDISLALEDVGVKTIEQDYSIYPEFPHSIGFSQRGCRLKCGFCVVPKKEGRVREEQTIRQIWRGEPHPRNILLLDNDFFGQEQWQARLDEMRTGDFRVSFNQGINFRTLDHRQAFELSKVRYSDDNFKSRMLYTAWDNVKDGKRLFFGLRALRRWVKPDNITVYMLIGYWPGETHADREIRRWKLRNFGCRPFPMPYVRTPELVGFQRWVVRRADLKMKWEEFMGANYRPEDVKRGYDPLPLLDEEETK